MTVRRAAAAVAALTAAACAVSLPASATGPGDRPHRTLTPARTAAQTIWPAPGALHTPAVPKITWTRCEEAADRRLGLECGTVPVPLDYAQPANGSILLNVVRHKASGPRKGAVFVNPGGPGGITTQSMGRFLTVLGKPVTSAFDIIGMDPRGVGIDSMAACWSRKDSPARGDDLPRTPKQVAARIAADDFERAACAATGRPIIDHMSTGDVARDMDLLRQSLGEKTMNYYGVSYGTVLGQTYAAMFPSKTRSMVLDGVVDAVDWTTGTGDAARTLPVSARTDSGPGADETLRSAFAACKAAGPKRCRPAATVAAEWDYLVDRLNKGDVKTADGVYTLADLLSGALTSLYDPDTIRPLMDAIHTNYLAVKGGGRVTRMATEKPHLGIVQPTVPAPDDVQWSDSFRQAGVMCSDSVNPSDPHAWEREGARVPPTKSWFSAVWNWNSSLCARWPGSGQGAYRGPFTVKPASSLLVVGNLHDPATPITSARVVAKRTPGARLLTVDAYGHTASDQSSCASAAMRTYLVSGTLPKEGLVCTADKPLF